MTIYRVHQESDGKPFNFRHFFSEAEAIEQKRRLEQIPSVKPGQINRVIVVPLATDPIQR